ncbi:MAG: hypothetical protein ACI9OJ_002466 [Myxococcota bacterium]|jgi:hypothetical protein
MEITFPLYTNESLKALDAARLKRGPSERLASVRHAAQTVHEEMMSASPVRFYRSFDLVRVPYPLRFALREACTVPIPLVHIMNRMFIVQFDSPGGIKTLVVSPSDPEANSETPFFKRMTDAMGPLKNRLSPVLAPIVRSVSEALDLAGISPGQVDYVTYDHLHTQDIRRWFGDSARPGFFPNAKLLVMRQEWISAGALLAPQRDWYCPAGLKDVPESRVIFLDGSTLLAPSVALVATPGHTEGNHSIAVRTDEGVMVSSENGVAAEAYAPECSGIPGMARYARDTGMEVVLNGNTMEGGLDQYLSMIAEKTIAGPSMRRPDLPNVVPSSELTHYWMFPGVRPSFTFGELSFGAPYIREA